MNAEQILEIPDVQERVKRYFEQEELFLKMLRAHSSTDGNVILLNLLDVDEILSGNRFVLYTLYPEQNISIRIIWGLKKQNVVFTVGHSILNKTSKTNVGSLMLKYGGGGHEKVGTCQVPADQWQKALADLIARMKKDG
jgi:nanoRNase/pAp phosphatase (c-di-AMP/oligoRNAs hydrolase)